MKLCIIARHLAKPIAEGHAEISGSITKACQNADLNPFVISLESRNGSFKSGITTNFVSYPFLSSSPIINKILTDLRINDTLVLPFISKHITNYDIVYLLNVDKETIAILAKLVRKKPKVVAHMLYPYTPALMRYALTLRLPLIRRGIYHHIFCINKYHLEYFSRITGSTKVHYVPYPIDTERFRPRNKCELRKSLGLPSDASIVGYIGNITPERGIFELLKAFSKLSKEEKLHFVIAASPYTETKFLREFIELIQKLDLGSRARILSKVKAEFFYSAADVMVLPFRYPYYVTDPPATVIEALTSGTPLITTPVGAIKEVVNEGRGLLVQPRNVDMLKDALEYLLSDEKARKKLGSNARDYTVKNLSLEVIGQKIKKIFQEISSQD